MKHILHTIKNGHILYDILDDDDNLIVGGISQPYSGAVENIDNYIVEHVYPSIETMLNPVESATKTIEASPILQAMEYTKESIKFNLVAYIKAYPDISLSDFLTYCESTFGWQEAGFIMKMIYEYVNQAAVKHIITLPEGASKENYFAIIKAIIVNNSVEELQEMLK